MILMAEKGIRSEIYYSVYQYGKATNTHLKDYDRNKELSYIQYWDANHLYGWAMSQKFPVKIFKWVTDVSKIDEIFMKCYNEKRDKGSFLEVDDILKIYIVFKTIYPFFPKKKIWKSRKACS